MVIFVHFCVTVLGSMAFIDKARLHDFLIFVEYSVFVSWWNILCEACEMPRRLASGGVLKLVGTNRAIEIRLEYISAKLRLKDEIVYFLLSI